MPSQRLNSVATTASLDGAKLQDDLRVADESFRWIRRGEVGGKYRVYADHVVEGLRELSDEAVQRERWVVGPESLSEAWEQVYDDSGLALVLDRPDAARLLTPSLAAAFETLDQALRSVDLNRPPEQIIEDPALTIVRTAATRALVLVKEQVSD